MCRLTELHPSQPTANCASEASELTGTCPVPSPVTGLPARHGAIPLREDRLTQPTQRRIRYAHAGPCTHRVSVLHCPCLGLPPPCPTSPNPTRPPPLTRAALRSCHPSSVLAPRPPLARCSDPDGAHRVRPGAGLAQLGLGPGPGSRRVVSSSPPRCVPRGSARPGDSLGLSFLSVSGLVPAERRGFLGRSSC